MIFSRGLGRCSDSSYINNGRRRDKGLVLKTQKKTARRGRAVPELNGLLQIPRKVGRRLAGRASSFRCAARNSSIAWSSSRGVIRDGATATAPFFRRGRNRRSCGSALSASSSSAISVRVKPRCLPLRIICSRISGRVVKTRAAAPDRRQQPALLIKAQGAQRHAIQAGDFTNGQGFAWIQVFGVQIFGGSKGRCLEEGGGVHGNVLGRGEITYAVTRKGCTLRKHNWQALPATRHFPPAAKRLTAFLPYLQKIKGEDRRVVAHEFVFRFRRRRGRKGASASVRRETGKQK